MRSLVLIEFDKRVAPRQLNGLLTALVLLMSVLFSVLTFQENSDFLAHIQQAQKIAAGNAAFPPNFLWQLVIVSLQHLNRSLNFIVVASAVLLATAVVLKFLESHKLIGAAEASYKSVLLCLGLLFCYPILDPYSVWVAKTFYMGKLVANIWHNPTTILVFPLTLMLYRRLWNIEATRTSKEVLVDLTIGLLIICIKPSFLFAFIPAHAIMVLSKPHSVGSKLKELILPIGLSIMIGIQFIGVFIIKDGAFQEQNSTIVFGDLFSYYLQRQSGYFLPLNWLLCLLFPVLTCSFYPRIFRRQSFRFVGLMWLIGIFISIAISETGGREGHGNFTWQNVFTTYLLFLECSRFLLGIGAFNFKTAKNRVLLGVFLIHVTCGLLYLAKILWVGNFY